MAKLREQFAKVGVHGDLSYWFVPDFLFRARLAGLRWPWTPDCLIGKAYRVPFRHAPRGGIVTRETSISYGECAFALPKSAAFSAGGVRRKFPRHGGKSSSDDIGISVASSYRMPTACWSDFSLLNQIKRQIGPFP
jgi:hypothetical protein